VGRTIFARSDRRQPVAAGRFCLVFLAVWEQAPFGDGPSAQAALRHRRGPSGRCRARGQASIIWRCLPWPGWSWTGAPPEHCWFSHAHSADAETRPSPRAILRTALSSD